MKVVNTKNVQIIMTENYKKLFKKNYRTNTKIASEVRQQVLNELILPTIEKGLSPVKGERMFQKYKDKNKYPRDLKPSNKPNLKLTGQMLKDYKVYPLDNEFGISMGIHKTASARSLLLAGVHNEGKNKHIPIRRFIPTKGDVYISRIDRAIRNIFAKIISMVIKSNQ